MGHDRRYKREKKDKVTASIHVDQWFGEAAILFWLTAGKEKEEQIDALIAVTDC